MQEERVLNKQEKQMVLDWLRSPGYYTLKPLVRSNLTDQELGKYLNQVVETTDNLPHVGCYSRVILARERPFLASWGTIALAVLSQDKPFDSMVKEELRRGQLVKANPYNVKLLENYGRLITPHELIRDQALIRKLSLVIKQWELPKDEEKEARLREHMIYTLGKWWATWQRGYFYENVEQIPFTKTLKETYVRWFNSDLEWDYNNIEQVPVSQRLKDAITKNDSTTWMAHGVNLT